MEADRSEMVEEMGAIEGVEVSLVRATLREMGLGRARATRIRVSLDASIRRDRMQQWQSFTRRGAG